MYEALTSIISHDLRGLCYSDLAQHQLPVPDLVCADVVPTAAVMYKEQVQFTWCWNIGQPEARLLVIYYRDMRVIFVTFKIVVRYPPFQVVLVRSRGSVIFWSPGLM